MLDTSTIKAARAGDAKALDTLVRDQQDRIHRLAARMLGDTELARDATQEILLRVITHLSTWREDARFSTWVYRIAVNHLLTEKKIRARTPQYTFDIFDDALRDGLADPDAARAEDTALLGELRVKCTMALLMCLDPDQRAAYVLGEVFEMDQTEACTVLDIAPATFRKRLSRARHAVETFTARACGVVSEGGFCSCPRRLEAAQACGRVGLRPSMPEAPDWTAAMQMARRAEAHLVTARLQRFTGPLSAPGDIASGVIALLDAERARLSPN